MELSEAWKDRFGGLTRIYGDEALERLKNARVCLIGIGGVGTWAAESLARSGIGHLTLVDRDDVCITNTNRQLHALEGQVGRYKTKAMAERLSLINPEITLETREEFFNLRTAEALFTSEYDVVIDAMDSTPDKALLVKMCLEKKIPLVVSGGAGGKTDPTKIQIADLGKVTGDPLIKSLRRSLKDQYSLLPGEKGLYGVDAVFSLEKAIMPWDVCSIKKPEGGMRIDCATGFGAASFVTGAFGLALTSRTVHLILYGSQV